MAEEGSLYAVVGANSPTITSSINKFASHISYTWLHNLFVSLLCSFSLPLSLSGCLICDICNF